MKSGGPLMSVQKNGNYQLVGQGANCVWFDGAKENTKVFAISVLKKIE